MARISLVEQYDNRDVIAQILRIRKDLLDTVEKAELTEVDDVCTLKITYKDGREQSYSWDSMAGAYVQEEMPEVSEGALWFKPSESILYVGMGMGWFPVTSPIEVDDALSDTSENPVQNKVITEALDNIGGFSIEDMGTYYLMTDGGNATLTDMGTYWELSWI